LAVSWRDWFRRPEAPAPVKKRYFRGAMPTRLTADWVTAPLTADEELKKSLRRLRDRARDLAHDTPHGARFVQLLKLHVVGPEGIQLQSRAYSTRGTLSESVNAKVEAAWDEWGQAGSCTLDGRLSWIEVLQLAIAGLATDGEFLARKVMASDGFRLEVLDPDALDESYNVTTRDKNLVVMGVELNNRNQPIAYHLLSSDAQRKKFRVRVPAAEILHVFLADRPGQTRGYPMMAPALLAHRYLDAYCEAHITAARMAAMKPIVYEQSVDAPDDPDTPDGRIVEELEPGISHLLPKGITANLLDPTYPTSTYKEFEKAMMMRIAAGYGVSYTSLTGDLEAVNYSSIRAGLLDERDYYRVLQRHLIDRICRPVFAAWLPVAGMRGAIGAISGTQEAEVLKSAAWQTRGWGWVDPMNDLAALKAEIDLGLNTRTSASAARGRDFEENLEQLAQEKKLADQYDVDVSGEGAASMIEAQAKETVANKPVPAPSGGAEEAKP
jgi:lambda family phage portal protein